MSRLALSLVLLSAPAWATATYPTDIKTHLSLASEPPQSCGLCHRNNVLGAGTVTTPFGTSMRGQGLVSNNTGSLTTALDALDTMMTDSDGDGVPDITELRNATNPNVADAPSDGGMGGGTGGGTGGGGEVLPPVRYGCGANAVPGLAGLGSAWLVLAVLRRRRRD